MVEHGPRFATMIGIETTDVVIIIVRIPDKWFGIDSCETMHIQPVTQWCFFQSPFFATRFGWSTQHYQHLPTIDVGCVFQFDLQFKMVLRAWYLEHNKLFSEPKCIDGSP